jgi:hypothetical protein
MRGIDADLTDIKSLTLDSNPDIVNNLAPAFEKYNEEQFVTVKLPGSSQPVGDQQSRIAWKIERLIRRDRLLLALTTPLETVDTSMLRALPASTSTILRR